MVVVVIKVPDASVETTITHLCISFPVLPHSFSVRPNCHHSKYEQRFIRSPIQGSSGPTDRYILHFSLHGDFPDCSPVHRFIEMLPRKML